MRSISKPLSGKLKDCVLYEGFNHDIYPATRKNSLGEIKAILGELIHLKEDGKLTDEQFNKVIIYLIGALTSNIIADKFDSVFKDTILESISN